MKYHLVSGGFLDCSTTHPWGAVGLRCRRNSLSKLGSFVGGVFRFCQLVVHIILASPFADSGRSDSTDKASDSPDTSTAVPSDPEGAVSGHSCTNACT